MNRTKWSYLAFALVAGSPALMLAQQRVAAPTGVTVTSDATALAVSWNNMGKVASYVVNRRSPQQALGTVTSSPYSGALPQAGVAYEYQVVSVGNGKNNTAGSAWVPYTVPLSVTTTGPGVIVTEPRPTPGTITPVPAGPSSLSAGSGIPGQIQLTWKEVANATGYRVTRSSTAPEPEAKIAEYSNTSQLAEGGIWSHTDAPVDLRWTYSYKVYALFGAGVSTPSPVASAKSIAVVQPTGLKYGVTLTPTPGRVNVALNWIGVPNVATYVITGADFIGMPTITVTGTSYTLNNVMASHTYRVCVGAVYPYSIGDPSTAPCIDIKLQ
jgi:fibronectin type 3 domain-containing protein